MFINLSSNKFFKILSLPIFLYLTFFDITILNKEIKANKKLQPATEQDLYLYKGMGASYLCIATKAGIEFPKAVGVATATYVQVIEGKHGGLVKDLGDKKIEREQVRIKDAETVIGQLDKAVQVLIDYDRIRGPKGSIAVRESQNEERATLSNIIDQAYSKIDTLSVEKLELDKEQLELEAEVGPIKYIAAFIYGDELDKTLLERAVRWIIITIIFVFGDICS